MRIVATALTAAALALLPVQAGASTPNASPEQTKPVVDAAQSNGSQMASTPSSATGTKKPTEQSATETTASAEGKPNQSEQAIANEHEASPAES